MLSVLNRNVFGHTVEMIWRLFLKVKILILLLSLSLISCQKTSQTDLKPVGNFKTAIIRSLWHQCSQTYARIKTPPQIYYPLCDCAVDVMIEQFNSVVEIQKLNKQKSEQLSVLIRLNCNEYRNGIITN